MFGVTLSDAKLQISCSYPEGKKITSNQAISAVVKFYAQSTQEHRTDETQGTVLECSIKYFYYAPAVVIIFKSNNSFNNC